MQVLGVCLGEDRQFSVFSSCRIQLKVALQHMTDHTTTLRIVATCEHKQLPLVMYNYILASCNYCMIMSSNMYFSVICF